MVRKQYNDVVIRRILLNIYITKIYNLWHVHSKFSFEIIHILTIFFVHNSKLIINIVTFFCFCSHVSIYIYTYDDVFIILEEIMSYFSKYYLLKAWWYRKKSHLNCKIIIALALSSG